MAPIVRAVGNRPEIIAPFLDRGAWGVQVPHVNTAAEARAAVDAVKYSPQGHRGIFSGGRPAGYGFKGTTAEYAKEANRQTLVCLMLEEVEAIENLPEMVEVPGVDVFFIGAGDLSQSMGHTGQMTHPDVQQMVERGVKTITGAGKIAGCSCPDNLIPKFLGLGVQYFHSGVNRLLQQSSDDLSEDGASGRDRKRQIGRGEFVAGPPRLAQRSLLHPSTLKEVVREYWAHRPMDSPRHSPTTHCSRSPRSS